jgi:hypothetical protein
MRLYSSTKPPRYLASGYQSADMSIYLRAGFNIGMHGIV